MQDPLVKKRYRRGLPHPTKFYAVWVQEPDPELSVQVLTDVLREHLRRQAAKVATEQVPPLTNEPG